MAGQTFEVKDSWILDIACTAFVTLRTCIENKTGYLWSFEGLKDVVAKFLIVIKKAYWVIIKLIEAERRETSRLMN